MYTRSYSHQKQNAIRAPLPPDYGGTVLSTEAIEKEPEEQSGKPSAHSVLRLPRRGSGASRDESEPLEKEPLGYGFRGRSGSVKAEGALHGADKREDRLSYASTAERNHAKDGKDKAYSALFGAVMQESSLLQGGIDAASGASHVSSTGLDNTERYKMADSEEYRENEALADSEHDSEADDTQGESHGIGQLIFPQGVRQDDLLLLGLMLFLYNEGNKSDGRRCKEAIILLALLYLSGL